LNNQESIGEIIKRHISLRGKTIKEVAYALNMNTKTLYDQLQHNRISASKLLDLSAYLDIDLEELKKALGYNNKQLYYKRIRAKRMGKEYKDSIKEDVLRTIQVIANEEYNGISFYERVISEFNGEIFFLLDVLLDEDYEILINEDDFESKHNQKIVVKRNTENIKLYDEQLNLKDFLLERNGETVLKELLKQFEVKHDMFVIYIDNEIIDTQKHIKNMEIEDVLDLGVKYHNEGKYELSIICFNHAIEMCENSNQDLKYAALTGRALALLSNDNITEAEAELSNILQIYQDSIFIRERLLEIYERTKNFSEANKIINELLQENSFSDYSKDELLAKKLYFLIQLNDKEEAINCCDLIIKTSYDPDFRKYAKMKKEYLKNENK